jgi:hypothetical protein
MGSIRVVIVVIRDSYSGA